MNLIKTIIVLVFFILSTVLANGQNSTIDSLKVLLEEHTQADTIRVNLLNTLAYEMRTRDTSKTRLYAEQSYVLSSQLGYAKGKAVSLWIIGITIMNHDYDKALNNFREALKIAEETGDKGGQCNYLIAVGVMEKRRGNGEASDEAYGQALRIAEQIKDKKLLVKAQIGIAGNNIRSGRLIEAMQQLQEVIQGSKEIDYKEMLARAYADMGVISNLQGNYPVALEYYLFALEINEKRDDYIGTFNCLSNIASIQSEHNEFEEALKTIEKTQQLAVQRQDSTRISICLNNFGNLYRQIMCPEEALEYFQKSLAMSKFNKIALNLSNLINIGSIYTERGEFEKAMANFNEALALAQKAGIKRVLGEVECKNRYYIS